MVLHRPRWKLNEIDVYLTVARAHMTETELVEDHTYICDTGIMVFVVIPAVYAA
jgi:hypothetical protein